MIKFFRHIRKSLLSENKFSKYLVYAVGEIILVVIGIMIALWINNKNQEYNNGKIARTYLEDFKRDLESDVNILEEKILKNEEMIQNVDSIYIALPKKDELSEKESKSLANWVNSLMGETYYVPEKTTIRQFESSSSSHLIKSKTLKDQLFSYYTANDVNENNFERSIQLYQHNFLTKDLMKFHKNYAQIPTSSYVTFQQYNDRFEIFAAIALKNENTKNQNKQYRKFKEMAENLIKLINSELD